MEKKVPVDEEWKLKSRKEQEDRCKKTFSPRTFFEEHPITNIFLPPGFSNIREQLFRRLPWLGRKESVALRLLTNRWLFHFSWSRQFLFVPIFSGFSPFYFQGFPKFPAFVFPSLRKHENFFGSSFFALGWLLHHSNPLPSRNRRFQPRKYFESRARRDGVSSFPPSSSLNLALRSILFLCERSRRVYFSCQKVIRLWMEKRGT